VRTASNPAETEAREASLAAAREIETPLSWFNSSMIYRFGSARRSTVVAS
jgi:hypothetical protein